MSVPGTDLQNWRWLRGRARRREYWLWLLVIVAWSQPLARAGDGLALGVLSWALAFAMTRRLHDVGLGAHWLLAGYGVVLALTLHAARTGQAWAGVAVLLAAGAGLLALGAWPGARGENRFGSPPGRAAPIRA